jgi:hypothetical protein
VSGSGEACRHTKFSRETGLPEKELVNVNTPEEWARLAQLLEGAEEHAERG